MILLLSIILPSFPLPAVAVEKKITPLVAIVSEPLTVQYFTVLFSAELINRIVEVPAIADVFVLVMIRSFTEHVAFTLQSIVTLPAPLR